MPTSRDMVRRIACARPSASLRASGAARVTTARGGSTTPAAAGTAPRGTSARIAALAAAPNTSPSSSELLARRFAPCSPVQAVSPIAYSPAMSVSPAPPVTMPPQL
jgi:hypothetical protein